MAFDTKKAKALFERFDMGNHWRVTEWNGKRATFPRGGSFSTTQRDIADLVFDLADGKNPNPTTVQAIRDLGDLDRQRTLEEVLAEHQANRPETLHEEDTGVTLDRQLHRLGEAERGETDQYNGGRDPGEATGLFGHVTGPDERDDDGLWECPAMGCGEVNPGGDTCQNCGRDRYDD